MATMGGLRCRAASAADCAAQAAHALKQWLFIAAAKGCSTTHLLVLPLHDPQASIIAERGIGLSWIIC